MPRFVRLRLEKIQRDFLWGGETLDSKPHLVKWDTVCFDRRKGGLGVRRLHSLNKALLWGWHSKEVRGGYGVGLCKTIRKLWDVVSSKLSFSVGNRKRIKFWKDKWCGDEPLNVSFLSLFALSNSKDAGLAELWQHSNEGVAGILTS
ncbi:putative ribonuclease H protein [Vitis vinifera]|uniref:Putative ribonuclease H protein n=1 Tax=Vitis vinifera TaxID=29760 RepID=A0A438CYT5_VITVI|nr:putative ribonuclease H protein [Vitis vinifera]